MANRNPEEWTQRDREERGLGNGQGDYQKAQGADPRRETAERSDLPASRQPGRFWRAAMSRFTRGRGEATYGESGVDHFEHAREGFRDFGVPSPTQGREIREHYDERDFPGRDDRYAGRSGGSFHPEATGGTAIGGSWGSSGAPDRAPARRTSGSGAPRRDWEPRGVEGRPETPRIPSEREPGDSRGLRRRLWEREDATARDVMTANPKSVRRDSSLRDVAQIMRDENCGIVPVVDDENRLVGLITDRDMVMRTFNEDRPWTSWHAREVMTEDVDAATPDETVHAIIDLMGRKQVRRVPVVDPHDRLVGMVSMADVANRADQDEELQEALDRISKRRSFWSRMWT